MNTPQRSDSGPGQSTAPVHATHGAREPSIIVDRTLHRIWNYRRVMRSPLFHPFRQLLRPLLRWTFKSHLFVYDDARPDSPIGVNLKPLGIATLTLSVLLAPLIFVMLLPLVLILTPAALVFGMLGVATTAAKTDHEDVEHHSLIWHAMH